MATILRRNLISVTEGPVTLLDACYHSRHPDRVILYFSKTTEIEQVHVNPPWRVVERISVDGAWTLHLEMRLYRWSCLVRIMKWSPRGQSWIYSRTKTPFWLCATKRAPMRIG